ncbi:MAG: porin family protein, partial [Saprospiraceae bacterium]
LDLALTSDFPLGEVVSFGPELHWMQKGYKIEDFGGGIDEATATLNYLELPLLVKFNFGGEDVKLFVMAGPSIGYLLSGKYDYDGVEEDEVYDFVNRIDVGAHLGAGVHLGPVVLDVRYMLGLSNYAKDNPLIDEIKNTGFGIGLGIMF